MGTITLEGMEFFAYHGFYEEEQRIGNRYTVDIAVTTDLTEAAISDQLSKTVNYEDLYRIVAEEMGVKSHLLEHIADRIVQRAYQLYPHIQMVEISVSKHNPPVGGVCARSKITIKR